MLARIRHRQPLVSCTVKNGLCIPPNGRTLICLVTSSAIENGRDRQTV